MNCLNYADTKNLEWALKYFMNEHKGENIQALGNETLAKLMAIQEEILKEIEGKL